jgi:hypothetical protein
VGRSGWDYVFDYHGDPGAALEQLRAATLSAGNYFWDETSDDYFGAEGWSGFCQLLYAGGRPTEIAFWGATGD